MGNPMFCTCCTPHMRLAPSMDDTAEPRWICPASGRPYALRDGALVGVSLLEPAGPTGPWDGTTAGAAPARGVRIDLSREGYS